MAQQGDTLHSEYHNLSRVNGYGIRRAGVDGILTNANVLAATDINSLVAIAQAPPATVHAEYAEFESLETIAALRFGLAIGDFTPSRVAAALTIAGLAGQTFAADEVDQGHLGVRTI